MADSRSNIPLTTETLNLLSARLFAHADSITNSARLDVAEDMRTAARLADKLVVVRSRLNEIVANTMDSTTRTRGQIHALLHELEA
jgi:hypothetical protein